MGFIYANRFQTDFLKKNLSDFDPGQFRAQHRSLSPLALCLLLPRHNFYWSITIK